jgi:diacylglycerol kinase family enzyme
MTTNDERRRVSGRQRIAAFVSLGCGVLLVASLLVFVYRNGHHLLLALVGLVVTVASGWWVVATRGPKRFVGLAGVVVGVGVVITVGIHAGSSADSPVVRIGLTVGLAAITLATARAALVGDVADLERGARAPVPEHPVLICNPWSGGGKVERFGLVELAHGLGVETVMLDHGLDLEQLARDAIARGADCLGMAGGDGSQALVASIAVEHDLPFVCVSAGTRNHFALDLGLNRDDPRESLRGFGDGLERRIDYATVNGRFLVNNASLGAYATIVQQEGYREAKVETSRTLLPDLLGQTDQPFDLQFTEPDGTEVDGAFVIQVSNNPYVLGPSRDVSQRRRLDTGQLGVFAITAKTGAEAASVVTLSLVGQRKQSKNWHEFTAETFEVRSRSGKAYIGVDGEALEMDTPLRFDIHPRALRLHVPSGNLAVARRRRARDVDLRDLVTVARGRLPESDSDSSSAPAADEGDSR